MDPICEKGRCHELEITQHSEIIRRLGPTAIRRRWLAVFSGCALLATTINAATDTPAGWTVAAPAFDLSLERLRDVELIDKLQDLDMARLNRTFKAKPDIELALLGGSIDLSAPDSSIRIQSPELRELVRRGVAALPALLEHVSDPRPSRMVFAIAHRRGSDPKPTATLGDEYDSRQLPAKNAGGVNTNAHVSTPVDQGYAVKVGDLCYVAIGQIVNRRLFVFSYTNSGFDEHGLYKTGGVMNGRPFGFDFVDSPVETPALAAAVRSDWHGLDERSHADSLRSDADSGRNAAGALCRLLAYYPAEGSKAVHGAIQRILAEQGEVNFWLIDHTISTLSSFWWDDLANDLGDLSQMAVTQSRRFQSSGNTSKNPLASGTAQVLASCADLLVHRADDTSLRSLMTEEIDRLRQQRAEYGGGSPTAYDYHLQRCESVLLRLNGEPQAKPSYPQELAAASPPPTVKVTLGKVEVTGMRWPMIQLQFGVTGLSRAEMAAGRIRVTNAVDDTGFDLSPGGTPSFVRPAVGRADDAVLSRNDPPSLDVLLNAPPGLAKRLVKLKGYVELVVPGYDHTSTVKLERVAAMTGALVPSPALADAHVTVTVFDAKACNDALSGAPASASGPQEYGARPHFTGPIPTGAPPAMFKEPTITDSDVAIGIDDPGERVIVIGFVAADGTPLRYNHNGWYHASGTNGRRFDVYRLERADVGSATLVLQLAIGDALVRAPFDFTDVALPDNLH